MAERYNFAPAVPVVAGKTATLYYSTRLQMLHKPCCRCNPRFSGRVFLFNLTKKTKNLRKKRITSAEAFSKHIFKQPLSR